MVFNEPRVLRSAREIGKMRVAGLVVWQAHQAAARLIKPGVTTAELNEVYRETFARHGATPLFLNYGSPPFPAETCISVNEEIVHGIPGSRALKLGDIVSLDTGCKIDGWCGDAAVTLPVGDISLQCQQLLDTTQGVLDLAIKRMQPGVRWKEIATEMETYVHAAGFSVVEEMVGHGIGRELHEPPQVPNYPSSELDMDGDFDLRPGVVLAVEPMVNVGTPDLKYLADRWTAVSADRKPSAHFEHTIAITKDGPRRLTGPPTPDELELVPPEFRDESTWIRW